MSILRADSIRDRAGTGAPDFPNGLTGNVTGNVTGTATTATNAQGLTGTPNITVGTVGCGNVTSTGDVTGVNATFSGNLTVQGTTTTIDTAVTSVDSLAVDGQVTALGNCGIGTNNPQQRLHVSSTASTYIQVQNTGDSVNAYYGVDTASAWAGSSTNHPFKLHTNNAERVRIDGNGTIKFKSALTEKAHYDTGGGLQSDYHHDMITYGNVYWSDTAAAGAFTFNLRGSATVALNDMMDIGDSFSFWLAHACHSDTTRYLTIFKVDNTAISGSNIIWSGGSAPTSAGGGTGTKDVYTFTVFKAGDASFRAFAAQTNHA